MQVAVGLLQLRHVAREFLPQRERRRVLQMGAADLHDVLELLGLGRQRGLELHQRWHQPVADGVHRRHVHGRGKHVVGRLALVHVVVRVDQAPLAARAAQQFAGAVGQHLVDVHVGLRARAGLPDHQREFVVMLAGQHLVGRGDDGRRPCPASSRPMRWFTTAQERLICTRARISSRGMRSPGDVEVLQRALGLGAPEPLGRNLDRAEGVVFNPGLHGRVGISCPLGVTDTVTELPRAFQSPPYLSGQGATRTVVRKLADAIHWLSR